MNKLFYTSFVLILLAISINISVAQKMNSKDIAIPLQVIVEDDPYPQITLKWKDYGYAQSYQILKKLRTQPAFPQNAEIVLDSGVTEWTDKNVEVGVQYEYGILANSKKYVFVDSTNYGDMIFIATGYTDAGIKIVPSLSPGTCLLLVDSTMKPLLAEEIEIFKQDLSAEGWNVVEKLSARAEMFDKNKVKATKALINDTYINYPDLSSIILFGRIPVPYSGSLAPDGHGDHIGAWPADVYYGTIDEFSWTDVSINNTSASREANKNIPGDGKFDVTTLGTMTKVNFAVGRIDMFNMPLFYDSTKANPEAELLRKYLNRNHLFRTNQIEYENKAIVDDNFSAQSYPEAFAASGWRAFTNFFDWDSVVVKDYLTTLSTNTYLWSYGCGGGSYTSCGGIGTSTNFTEKPNNGLFTALFGSYFGDWDAQNNFLRSAVASDPGALTICWSGRPHWFFHHMGLGETIGSALLTTQNNNNYYYPNVYYTSQYPNGILYRIGTRQVHISLIGDPTLKMFNNSVGAPQNLQISQVGKLSVKLSWEAPAIPGNYLYAIYRTINGQNELLTKEPVKILNFTDDVGKEANCTYYVKALQLGTSHSGSFYYSSNPISADFDVVGVNDDVLSEVIVSPNPATDKVSIQFMAASDKSFIEITDLTGNIINKFELNTNAGLTAQLIWSLNNFDGQQISSGVYFVKITSGISSEVMKVVKY